MGLREIPLARFMKVDRTAAERKGGTSAAERARRHAENLLVKTARGLDIADCKPQMIKVFHAKNGHRHPILLLNEGRKKAAGGFSPYPAQLPEPASKDKAAPLND